VSLDSQKLVNGNGEKRKQREHSHPSHSSEVMRKGDPTELRGRQELRSELAEER
jgi:hypothetical protein